MSHPARHIAAAALAALALALGGAACSGGGASQDDGAAPSLRQELPEKRTGRVTAAAYVRARLHRASVAFTTPDRVRLEETREIELVLSDDASVRELKRRLVEQGRRVGARIRAADVMEATLTGTAFKIEDITPAQQAVAPGVTRWKWEIEPTRTGSRQLHLTVTALVAVDGKDRRQAVRTFERTLQVEAVAVAMPARLAGFLTGNWQWLVTTLLLPAVVWAVQRRRTRPAGFEPATSRSGGERSIH